MLIFSPPDETITPLTIVVNESQKWLAFGQSTTTLRDLWLYQILTGMGGIAETAVGTYHFNVLEVDGEFVASLTPAPVQLTL